jgi:hypothetical protein
MPVPLPVKFTVPPLALNVEPLLKVMLPLNEAVPDGAVNTAVEFRVNVESTLKGE